MKTHKMIEKKVKPGHNPFQPLCDNQSGSVHMAKDWKHVDCQKCHMIRGKKLPDPCAAMPWS